MRRMAMCCGFALLVGSGLAAQPVPALEELVGARGMAVDTLGERGFVFSRGEKSDSASFTFWTEEETGRCVRVAVSEGRVASADYVPDETCKGAQPVVGEGAFPTVCGVYVDGRWFRYRCEAEDQPTADGGTRTLLRFPDLELELNWLDGERVRVVVDGMKPVEVGYSRYEGETNFVMDGKTYSYWSDPVAARMEWEHFEE